MLKCRWIIDRAWTFRLSYKLLGNLTTAAAAAAVAATDDDYDDYDDDDDDATFFWLKDQFLFPVAACWSWSH